MTGAELRALRIRAGIGLRELAAAIGRDRGHLSRVERGQREVTPALVTAYQAALSAGTVDDMRRRSILVGAASLPALALPSGSMPSRIGEAEVSAVRALALNLDLGHPFGLDAAEAGLQRAAEMLQGRVSTAITPRLHEAVALLADRVGWGQHEAGRNAASTLLFAYRTAERGGDDALSAHALLDLSVTTANPREAVTALDHGLAGTVQGAERANLHAVAARRLAGYDPQLAREHLARAFGTEPTPGSGEWSQQITDASGHLDAIIGFACYAVGHPDARQRLGLAIRNLGPNRRRTRARCHLRLAGLSLDSGDETTALAHLRYALSFRRSVMVTSDLRAFSARARAAGKEGLARLAAKG